MSEENKEAGTLDELLETPMTMDEANDEIAKIDVRAAQLRCIRLTIVEQLNKVDLDIAQCDFDRSIIAHRVLVGSKQAEAEDGGADA